MSYYPKFSVREWLILYLVAATAIAAACLKSYELATLCVVLVLVFVAAVLKEPTTGRAPPNHIQIVLTAMCIAIASTVDRLNRRTRVVLKFIN